MKIGHYILIPQQFVEIILCYHYIIFTFIYLLWLCKDNIMIARDNFNENTLY